MMKKTILFFVCFGMVLIVRAQRVSTFEDLELQSESYWNGSDGRGFFKSGNITFYNSFNFDWYNWSGFSYTNMTDTVTPGWGNQYSAVSGKGNSGSVNYATVYCFGDVYLELDLVSRLDGFYITNSTYTYLSMRDGDDYSKKFGGLDGSDPDYFKLYILGIDEQGDTTGVVEFYLADFRFDNSSLDYILNEWKWVDLYDLGKVKKLYFSLESSDNSIWGMNTPSYFCMDDILFEDEFPVVNNPIEDIITDENTHYVFYIPLKDVFTDPDTPDNLMEYRIEDISDRSLVNASIVKYKKGSSGSFEDFIVINITKGITGQADVTVSVRSNGLKTEDVFSIIVDFPVSVYTVDDLNVEIYPNPVDERFFIRLISGKYIISLIDISGRMIMQQIVTGREMIEINNLASEKPGTYILRLSTDTETKSYKVLKK